ncbi:MAG: membrane dipeptidase [Clostridia bacterium]|nr:membrane dipeptidase [Clostridia bacterium]
MKYFDLHCDTLCRCADEKAMLEKNDFHIDIERLSTFEKATQVFACFIHDDYKGEGAINRFYQLYNVYKNTDFKNVMPMLSIENLSCLNGNIENIAKFKECGVKIASLTWNDENGIAGGVNSDRGLTDFGKEVVKELEREDIVIDVSHLNFKSFADLCSVATKPFIATHSNSFSVFPHKRNLTDEQFELIADIGGVVGINFYHKFLCEKENDFYDFLNHIERFLLLGGEESIALGSDFDGCEIHSSLKAVENMPNLYAFLERELGKTITDKIFYKNCASFFQNTLTK